MKKNQSLEIENQYIPKNDKEFRLFLEVADWETLESNGFRIWRKKPAGRPTLVLFPADYYNAIPEGLPIVYVSGQESRFHKDITTDDIFTFRDGQECLLFGIKIIIKK